MFSFFDENQLAADTLQAYIRRKLPLPGSPEFAYAVVSKKNPSEMLAITSYPQEWVSLYRASNFQLIDPVILTAFKRTSPFIWDGNIVLITDKLFSLSSQYNIVNGCSFVLHDHLDNLAILSVVINNNELEQHLASGRDAMQMLLIDIHEQMYRLAGSALAGGCYRKANKAIFTARENEVLYWASMGKTYDEIAMIAGISITTVKFHMRNVVSKLGVSNARQAIRLGTELALIRPA